MATVFPQSPLLKPITNDKWLVEEHFMCAHKKYVVNITKGFESDGASIPNTPLIRWLIGHPFSLPLLPCALVHDALYAGELMKQKEADWFFLELMQKAGIGWAKRNAVYSAVRLAGWAVWRKHTKESIAHARKHCSLVRV